MFIYLSVSSGTTYGSYWTYATTFHVFVQGVRSIGMGDRIQHTPLPLDLHPPCLYSSPVMPQPSNFLTLTAHIFPSIDLQSLSSPSGFKKRSVALPLLVEMCAGSLLRAQCTSTHLLQPFHSSGSGFCCHNYPAVQS